MKNWNGELLNQKKKQALESRGIETDILIHGKKYNDTFDLCYLLDKYKDEQVKKFNISSVSKSLPSSEYIWIQGRSESDRRRNQEQGYIK